MIHSFRPFLSASCFLFLCLQTSLALAAPPATFPTSGLIARYAFDEGTGSTVHDSGGNAYHLLIPPGPGGMTWTGGGLLSLGGDSTHHNHPVFPAAVSSARTVMVYGYFPYDSTTVNNMAILLGNATGGQKRIVTQVAGPTFSGFGIGNALTAATFTGSQWSSQFGHLPVLGSIAVLYDTAADSYFYDGVQGSCATNSTVVYLQCNGTAAISEAGQWSLFDEPGFPSTSGRIYYAAFWNRKLSAAEITQAHSFIANAVSKRSGFVDPGSNAGQFPGNFVLGIGDSFMSGYTTDPLVGHLNLLTTAIPNVSIHNFSVPGAEVSDASAGFAFYAKNLPTRSAFSACIFAVAANDLRHCRSNAAVLQDLVRLRSVMGSACTVSLVGTVASAGGTPPPCYSSFDDLKNQFNAFLRSSFAPTFDGLLDIAADPHFGADGSYANATFFNGDLTHPNNFGQLQVSYLDQRTLDFWYGFNLGSKSAPSVSSPTYQMADRDAFLEVNTGSNSVAITLPDCIGPTGSIRTIHNAGSRPATVQGLNTELVNNSATPFTIAPKATVRLRDTLNADSTGGCNWQVI